MKKFMPSGSKELPSTTAFYHDQKGNYSDPQQTSVDPSQYKILHQIKEEYMEHQETTKEEIKRLNKVMRIIKIHRDTVAASLLGTLLRSCIAYRESVINHALATSYRDQEEGAHYRIKIENMDQLRKLKHNRLIDELKTFNRYIIKQYGEDGEIEPHDQKALPPSVLYTGTSSDRRDIGFWALRLADGLDGLTIQRKRNIKPIIDLTSADEKAA